MTRLSAFVAALAATSLFMLVGCTANGPSKAPGPFPVVNPGGAPHAQYVVIGNVISPEALLTYNLGTGVTPNSGNLAPTYNNHSSSINQPFFIFNDYQSNLWAAEFSGSAVTWFSITGNGTPTAHNLSGSNTTLGCPTGVYVDPHGNLYVADPCSTRGYPTIDYFKSSGSPASPPSGNVAPFAWIGGGSTTLSFPQGLAVDGKGNLWVIESGSVKIDQFPTSLSAGQNNIAPNGSLTSSSLSEPDEIYIDNNSDIWVGDLTAGAGDIPAILEFNGTTGAQTPLCTISGSNTGLSAINGQISVAVDNGGYVYGVDAESAQISIFSKGQCGNVTPAYTIAGASTVMTHPAAVVVYSTGNDY